MAEPLRQTAFQTWRLEGSQNHGVQITPLEPRHIWSLRADDHVAALIAQALNIQAPAMLRYSQNERATLARLGPDELLLQSSDGEAIQPVINACQNHHHAIADISNRITGIEIKGPATRDLINGACPLNLTGKATPVGTCTRTIMGKAEIILTRQNQDQFTLQTNRSFTPYLINLTNLLAREHA